MSRPGSGHWRTEASWVIRKAFSVFVNRMILTDVLFQHVSLLCNIVMSICLWNVPCKSRFHPDAF